MKPPLKVIKMQKHVTQYIMKRTLIYSMRAEKLEHGLVPGQLGMCVMGQLKVFAALGMSTFANLENLSLQTTGKLEKTLKTLQVLILRLHINFSK